MEIISNKNIKIEEKESAKWHIGKKVIAKTGTIMGKITDVIFTEKGIKGYVVKNGFTKVFINKEYIEAINDGVMLKIDPVTNLQGKLVYDSDGKKLGKVKRITRNNTKNIITEIAVKARPYSKEIIIPKKDIAIMKKNIILKNEYNK